MTLSVGATAATVGALRDAIRAALPLPDASGAGVHVFDGPAPERAYASRAVTVAAAFQDDQDAVMVERVESGARPSVVETVTVAGSVYVGGGDTEVEAYRAEAGGILAAIEARLRVDRTLGGVVSRARLVSSQWTQGRDVSGTGVAIGFTVELVSLL